MTNLKWTAGVVILVAGTLACNRASQPAETAATASGWTVTIQPVQIPAAPDSSIPHLSASSHGVIASWVEQDGARASLKFANRTADGWSAPTTVASGTGWFLSWADAPSVMRLSDGTLVADWFVTTREEIEAYNTLMSYSKDEGKTWAKPFLPHRDQSQTQHGFPTIVEMPDRQVGMVWLDGRDMDNNTTDPEGGVMTLRFTSFDAAWKQSPDVEVNARVCECCQTAAAMTPDGLVAAFRDRSENEIRDIAVSRLEKGAWTPAQLVSADNYMVDSCPVNGPALSARGRDLAAAWYTVKENKGRAYAAFSRDAGRTWSAPQRLDGGESLGMVDIEWLDDGGAAATWVEFGDKRRRLMLRHVDPDGPMSAPVTVAGTGPGRLTGYPRLARDKGELLLAWTETTGQIDSGDVTSKVLTAVARLPR